MKPEQQRIAIAEACGFVKNTNTAFGKTSPWWTNPAGQIFFATELPNYLNDLNAMHEAEKVLTDHQYHMQFLPYLGASAIHDSVCVSRRVSSATAAQRAEVFLRTLNLWTES